MDALTYVRNVVCVMNACVWRYVFYVCGVMYGIHLDMIFCMRVYICKIYCIFVMYVWLSMILHTHRRARARACLCVCVCVCVCAF
jgi:hypothetical protein